MIDDNAIMTYGGKLYLNIQGKRPDDVVTWKRSTYYSDVLMREIASQITGVSIVYSTVCWGADKRKH